MDSLSQLEKDCLIVCLVNVFAKEYANDLKIDLSKNVKKEDLLNLIAEVIGTTDDEILRKVTLLMEDSTRRIEDNVRLR